VSSLLDSGFSLAKDGGMKRNTGLKDCDGREIFEGDFVSLDGQMTADDSMGLLPNGWVFDEADIYEVVWDDRMKLPQKWSLRMKCSPDNPYHSKYMSHVASLLMSGDCKVVDPSQAPSEIPDPPMPDGFDPCSPEYKIAIEEWNKMLEETFSAAS
jgi:hypothetical protein